MAEKDRPLGERRGGGRDEPARGGGRDDPGREGGRDEPGGMAHPPLATSPGESLDVTSAGESTGESTGASTAASTGASKPVSAPVSPPAASGAPESPAGVDPSMIGGAATHLSPAQIPERQSSSLRQSSPSDRRVSAQAPTSVSAITPVARTTRIGDRLSDSPMAATIS